MDLQILTELRNGAGADQLLQGGEGEGADRDDHAREALGDGARGERPLGRAGDAIETLWGGGPDELISG